MKPSRSPLFHAFAWSSSTLRIASSGNSFGSSGPADNRSSSAIMADSLCDLGGGNAGVVGQPLMDAVVVDLEGEVGRPRRGLDLQVGRHAGVAVILHHLALVAEDA